MNVKYFQDADALYIEFKGSDAFETRELDENMYLDVDREGRICAITMEHASDRTDAPLFSYEQVAA